MIQDTLFEVKKKRRRAFMPNDEWARRAIISQADIVLSVMEVGKNMSLDALLDLVNEVGHSFEASHIRAAIKNLKERSLVEQVGPAYFKRKPEIFKYKIS